VDNALASIPDTGAVTLSVRGEPDAERVRVEVADTGVGIPEPDKARSSNPIFPPSGRHRLGLAIVQSIIPNTRGSSGWDNSPGAPA